ncbi:hypothetical protein JCM6882_003131 [Rhodosporidiobolus microsporus]
MATSPNAELHDCAVCEEKTASVCSGCKTTFFCSREHQKLVYSTHKHLCKGPPDACYLPPLTVEEVAALSPGHQGEVNQEAILQSVRRNGWWTGTLEDLLRDLSSTSSTLEEPRRSRLLASLHQHLLPPPSASWLEFRKMPWTSFATFQRTILDPQPSLMSILEPDKRMGEDPFRRFSTIYRQYLILTTLRARAVQQPPPAALTRRILNLAKERVRKLVDEVDLPPGQLQKAKFFLDILLEGADGDGVRAEATLMLPE